MRRELEKLIAKWPHDDHEQDTFCRRCQLQAIMDAGAEQALVHNFTSWFQQECGKLDIDPSRSELQMRFIQDAWTEGWKACAQTISLSEDAEAGQARQRTIGLRLIQEALEAERKRIGEGRTNAVTECLLNLSVELALAEAKEAVRPIVERELEAEHIPDGLLEMRLDAAQPQPPVDAAAQEGKAK